MKKTRKQHSAAFKAEVALAAIQERETLSELSARYGVHPTVISKWKKTFLERSSELDFEKERQDLYAKIGELEMQRDWLKKKSKQLGLE